MPLATETRHFDACPAALLSPVRFAVIAGDPAFLFVDSGHEVDVIWPIGFTAWYMDGHGVLLDSSGKQVAQEGDMLDNLGGAGEPFHVCSIGPAVYL